MRVSFPLVLALLLTHFANPSIAQAIDCAEIADQYIDKSSSRWLWGTDKHYLLDYQCPKIPRPCEAKRPSDPNSVCTVTGGIYSPGCYSDEVALDTLYDQELNNAREKFINRSILDPLQFDSSHGQMTIPQRVFKDTVFLLGNWVSLKTPNREVWEKAQEIVFNEGCPKNGVFYDANGQPVKAIGLLKAVRKFNKNSASYYARASQALNQRIERSSHQVSSPQRNKLDFSTTVLALLTSILNSGNSFQSKIDSDLGRSIFRFGRLFQRIAGGRVVPDSQFRSAFEGMEQAAARRDSLSVIVSFLWTKIYSLLRTGSGRAISADFNRDGKTDYAIQEPNSTELKVYLRQASAAAYRLSDTLELSSGDRPSAVDLTGDGILDIYLGTVDSNGRRYFIGIGDGTFVERDEAIQGAPAIVGSILNVTLAEMCVTSSALNATNCFRSSGRMGTNSGALFGRFSAGVGDAAVIEFRPYQYSAAETFTVTFRVLSGGVSESSIQALYLDGEINASIASYTMDPGLVNGVQCVLPMAERGIILYARRCVTF